ncbi:MAG: hypothetical protein Q7J61_03615, partial [Deltaproteobacteria bacterium]|nr:hypothetical protein [Deltaproteobacteria bacterium]
PRLAVLLVENLPELMAKIEVKTFGQIVETISRMMAVNDEVAMLAGQKVFELLHTYEASSVISFAGMALEILNRYGPEAAISFLRMQTGTSRSFFSFLSPV